jgi:uncharacterized protein
MTFNEIVSILVIGLAAGFLSGSMGIGGAIIVVPSLVFVMGLTMHQAQGTSLALMTMPVMLIATFNYYRTGNVNLKYAGIMACTFVVGGFLGSKLSLYMPESILRKIFGVLIIIIALKMIFSK